MTTAQDQARRDTERALIYAVDHNLIPMGEIGVVAGLAASVKSGRPLVHNDAARAWRVLNRHRATLTAHGITLPAPKTPVAAAPNHLRGEVRPEVAIRADGRIGVRYAPFTANEGLRLGLHATFENRTKEWHLSPTPLGAAGLLALLSGTDPLVSARVQELAGEAADAAAHRRVLDPTSPPPPSDTLKWVLSPLWEHQSRALEYSSTVSASMIAVPMGGGKALDVSTAVATPSGWTAMGELRAGDIVFDERGQECTVLQVHPVLRDRHCYEVMFSDGASIVADADHLWWTETRQDREKQCYRRRRNTDAPSFGGVRTTEEIRASLRVGARGLTNHSVPVASALVLPDVDVPIPPYVLGAWLGDGDSASGRITTADGPEMRDIFAFEGYHCGKNGSGPDRTETFTIHGLMKQLRTLGVLGGKHIPATYLRASEKQRRALLAGLLDTDGTVCRHGRIQFDSIRERLANEVLELALSLGYRATITGKDAKLNGRVISRVWRVSFTTADPVFLLSRKRRAHEERSGADTPSRVNSRYITDVRPVSSRPVRCITVDSPSRLYLAGRAMIPTHNTASTVATANKVDASRVLIVCPNKVRGVWPREVAKWSARSWHIVDGKKHAQRRNARPQDLTVADRLAEAESCLFDCQCDAAVHAAVFNYEMLVREPVASWVPQLPLDLIVYDEIHRLKSPTGKMSKVAARLVDFSLRRIGLSGTPMPQYPWDIFGVYRALDPAIFGHVWTPFKSKYVVTREREGISGKMEEFPVGITPEYSEEFARKVHSIMYRPTIDLKLPGVEHIVRDVELEPAARKVYASLDEEMFADLRKFARPGMTGAQAGAEFLTANCWSGEDGDDGGDVNAVLTPKNILSRMLRLMQLTGGTVPDNGEHDSDGRLVRQSYRVSYAKAEVLRDILDEIGCVPGMPNGPEPVIVYCQFRSDLDAVREVVEAAGLDYAEISGRRSDGLSARSEMTEFADVVGVQIQSGGTGVDLTRARYGIWYSTGYSLGDYDQALKRQDRPGQTRPVVFIHLVCAGTIDPDVYTGLSRRGSVVGSFLTARGINPAVLGIRDTVVPEEAVDRSGRGGAAVALPIDELKPAPWDHVGKGAKRPARTAADWVLLREFEIEDL